MRRSRLGVRVGGTARFIWSNNSPQHLADRIATARASGDTGLGWRLHVTHRELAREGLEAAYLTDRPVPRSGQRLGDVRGAAATAAPVQAQEA